MITSHVVSRLLCITVSSSLLVSARVDYSGYQVLKFRVSDTDHERFLSSLTITEAVIGDDQPIVVGRETTLAVATQHVDEVLDYADKLNMETVVVYQDLQKIIDVERGPARRGSGSDEFDLDEFNTYESIMEQLDTWATSCPVGLECTVKSYGATHEGRELKYIKLGLPGGSERAYWVEGGIHCREWLSTATLLKIVDGMIGGFGSDDTVTSLLTDYDWYFTPVASPDGYAYTFNQDRMWHKNRGHNEGTECVGTDVDRNFDVFWGTEGVTHDPCGFHFYCGSSAVSELETQAIQDEVNLITTQQTLLAFVDMHSFGEMVFMPYSFTVNSTGEVCARPDNYDDQLQVSNAFADAIEATFGTDWLRGSACEVLSATASGGSKDWATYSGNARYSFLTELRGPFFVVDPVEIQPSYQEFWNGLVAMVDEIRIIEGF